MTIPQLNREVTMNDSKFFFPADDYSRNNDTAFLDSASDEFPEKRWCQYIVQQAISAYLLGIILVPVIMDVDDAFPIFHSENFAEHDRDELADAIRDGAVLIAESNFEPRSLLAYRLDDPHYWYGREATLKYFGVDFVPAC